MKTVTRDNFLQFREFQEFIIKISEVYSDIYREDYILENITGIYKCYVILIYVKRHFYI